MKRPNPQWWLSILLLLLFLGSTSLEYHAIGHTDEDATSECELCEFVILSEHTPYVPVEEMALNSSFSALFEGNKPLSSPQYFSAKEVLTARFCRPPPALILT